MSSNHKDDAHTGPIKTPKQLLAAVLYAFVIPIFLIIGLVMYITSGNKAQCAACHATGAAGAPKLADAGAWGPRIQTGFDALVQSALKGKNAMAAQGGGDFSDIEIARAVAFLANAGGASFEAPQPPATAASDK